VPSHLRLASLALVPGSSFEPSSALPIALLQRLSHRAPLSCLRLSASFRDHPSDSGLRLFGNLSSGSASWLGIGLRRCPTAPPRIQSHDSLRRRWILLLCCSCPRDRLASALRAFRRSHRFRLELAPVWESPAPPSCLTIPAFAWRAGLSASPSYLTAGFPAAFLLWRCPWFSLWLSPSIPPWAHPSDSYVRRVRLSPLRCPRPIKPWLSPWFNFPGITFELSNRLSTRSSV